MLGFGAVGPGRDCAAVEAQIVRGLRKRGWLGGLHRGLRLWQGSRMF